MYKLRRLTAICTLKNTTTSKSFYYFHTSRPIFERKTAEIQPKSTPKSTNHIKSTKAQIQLDEKDLEEKFILGTGPGNFSSSFIYHLFHNPHTFSYLTGFK